MAGMKKLTVLAVVIAALATTVAAQRAGVRTSATVTSLVVRDVTLLDGTGGTPRPHVDIVARNGRIAEIVSSQASSAADLVVNARNLFAIPGLFDAHVHLSPAPMNERIDQLRRTLNGGVTGVFDLAGDLRETSDLARMVLAGDIQAPTIFYAALVAGPAFFTDPRVVSSSLGFRPGEAPWAQAITPETDIVRAVAAARGAGATALKLYAALDATEVRRIADEGRRQGLRLVAHATVFPAKPGDLVAAGVNMLAHAAYLVWEGSPPSPDFTKRATGDFAHVPANAPEIERLLASMHDRDVALNPTLWIFEQSPASPDQIATARTAWMNAVTRRAAELGVPIVAGTDDMFDAARDPLPILHRELEVLVSGAGLTPMQALVAATRNAARAIGVESSRGTIEPGKIADIVLLEANPADDIRNTRKIRFVIKDGRIVLDAGSIVSSGDAGDQRALTRGGDEVADRET
jgi:imidazolonepropionase-like amidohydrolase